MHSCTAPCWLLPPESWRWPPPSSEDPHIRPQLRAGLVMFSGFASSGTPRPESSISAPVSPNSSTSSLTSSFTCRGVPVHRSERGTLPQKHILSPRISLNFHAVRPCRSEPPPSRRELGQVLETRRVVSLEERARYAAGVDDGHHERLERGPVELLELLVAHEAAGPAMHGDEDARIAGDLHDHHRQADRLLRGPIDHGEQLVRVPVHRQACCRAASGGSRRSGRRAGRWARPK